MAESKRTRAIFLLVTAAVLWSLAGVLIKWVSLPALAVAGYRSAIALPVLLIFFGRRAVNLSAAQLIGGIAYAATVILFVSATKLTTAGNAILLQYTAPLYVALLSGWLLHERTRWFDWVAIAAVLGGMSLFFLDQLSSGGLTGNILAVISGFAFASLVLATAPAKGRIARGFRHSGQPFDRPDLPALDGPIPAGRSGLDRSCAPWRLPDRALLRLLCRSHQECDGHGGHSHPDA